MRRDRCRKRMQRLTDNIYLAFIFSHSWRLNIEGSLAHATLRLSLWDVWDVFWQRLQSILFQVLFQGSSGWQYWGVGLISSSICILFSKTSGSNMQLLQMKESSIQENVASACIFRILCHPMRQVSWFSWDRTMCPKRSRVWHPFTIWWKACCPMTARRKAAGRICGRSFCCASSITWKTSARRRTSTIRPVSDWSHPRRVDGKYWVRLSTASFRMFGISYLLPSRRNADTTGRGRAPIPAFIYLIK